MSKRFLGWLQPDERKKVLDMVQDHLELTLQTVIHLGEMVEASSDNNADQKDAHYKELSGLEMRADELRRKIIEELTTTKLSPEERDDLMELVRSVDWIADWSKEAGRILKILPYQSLNDELKADSTHMVNATINCVKILVSAYTTPVKPSASQTRWRCWRKPWTTSSQRSETTSPTRTSQGFHSTRWCS